jgi:hypothetical protein
MIFSSVIKPAASRKHPAIDVEPAACSNESPDCGRRVSVIRAQFADCLQPIVRGLDQAASDL